MDDQVQSADQRQSKQILTVGHLALLAGRSV